MSNSPVNIANHVRLLRWGVRSSKVALHIKNSNEFEGEVFVGFFENSTEAIATAKCILDSGNHRQYIQKIRNERRLQSTSVHMCLSESTTWNTSDTSSTSTSHGTYVADTHENNIDSTISPVYHGSINLPTSSTINKVVSNTNNIQVPTHLSTTTTSLPLHYKIPPIKDINHVNEVNERMKLVHFFHKKKELLFKLYYRYGGSWEYLGIVPDPTVGYNVIKQIVNSKCNKAKKCREIKEQLLLLDYGKTNVSSEITEITEIAEIAEIAEEGSAVVSSSGGPLHHDLCVLPSIPEQPTNNNSGIGISSFSNGSSKKRRKTSCSTVDKSIAIESGWEKHRKHIESIAARENAARGNLASENDMFVNQAAVVLLNMGKRLVKRTALSMMSGEMDINANAEKLVTVPATTATTVVTTSSIECTNTNMPVKKKNLKLPIGCTNPKYFE